MYEHDILQRKRYEYAPIAIPSGVRRKAVPSGVRPKADPSGEGGDPGAYATGEEGGGLSDLGKL